MNDIKTIPHRDIPGAADLSAPELNKIRFSTKHTILTPRKLKEAEAEGTAVSVRGAN